MFENLRRAFREAIDNFYEELNRDHIPENVDKLLGAMRQEMTDAKTHIRRLEEEITKAAAGLEREREAVQTCLRREDMALKIGDEDTARVAREYAEKHERMRMALEQKVEALTQEKSVVEAEFAEMTEQFKQAESSRASLSATAGRSDARDSISEAGDLFEQLDRMAERIEDEDARAAASEEMASDFDLRSVGPDSPVPPVRDLDERLRDLKRRMGSED